MLGAGLGDLGAVAPPVEPDELPLDPEELLLLPPLLELDPDLLKWASHSEREIVPSLLVSTDEKLGWEALPELAAPGDVVLLDVPPAAPVDFEEESAAMASDESANSAAAVVTVTLLII